MADLHTCDWKPDGVALAHVLIVHGYAEHSGRYAHLATALCARGIHVHAYDHRGHGRSPGRWGRVDDFGALVDDLAEQCYRIQRQAADLPVFLFAHSMGGLIASNFLARQPTGIAGAVISGPLLAIPENVSSLLLRLAGFLGAVAPWLPVDRLDSAKISRDAQEVAAYDADPLIYPGAISARTGVQLSAGIAATKDLLPQIAVPLLVIHGEADELAPPQGGHQLFERASSQDKSGHFQPGGYHELLHDLDQDEILALVVDWIVARVP